MAKDPWKHANKEWQITLDLARSLGWPTPTYGTSHQVLTLKCLGDEDPCIFKIYSTGKGTENAARTARRKIPRCSHVDHASSVNQIRSLLNGMTLKLSAIERLLRREEAERRCHDILELQLEVNAQMRQLEEEFDRLALEIAENENVHGDDDELLQKSVQDELLDVKSALRDVKSTIREELPVAYPERNELERQSDLLENRVDTALQNHALFKT